MSSDSYAADLAQSAGMRRFQVRLIMPRAASVVAFGDQESARCSMCSDLVTFIFGGIKFQSPLYRPEASMFFKEGVGRLVSSFNDGCCLIYGPGAQIHEHTNGQQDMEDWSRGRLPSIGNEDEVPVFELQPEAATRSLEHVRFSFSMDRLLTPTLQESSPRTRFDPMLDGYNH
ncbi:hypothetical protein MLD38_001753 [Melastoma candidum]|uniref:Uncharacterized protein n=1 Tax=Melastoma candidum TaxID=119954 RepID=A0ACB9SFJ5_9MYRT|nr:hypothetical protein MLD38_001753 [Melastoma candidum]